MEYQSQQCLLPPPHRLSPQKLENGGKSYAVLSVDGMPSCVTSLDNKPHLLPNFLKISSAEKIFSSEKSLSASLSLPICSEEQENFILGWSQKTAQVFKPEQVAGYWTSVPIVAWWTSLALNGVACFTSYQTGKHIVTKDPKVLLYGLTTVGMFLLPGILKAPVICGGIGAGVASNVSLYNVEEVLDLPDVKMEDLEDAKISSHVFLNSVVTITSIEKATYKDEEREKERKKEIEKLVEDVRSVMEDIGSVKEEEDDDDTNRELEEIMEMIENNMRKQIGGLGSGFFVDKDKIVTNYHVVQPSKERIKDHEYETKYIVRLFDGREFVVKEILAIDSTKDLAVLQIDKPVGIPVKLGNSDNLELLQEVVVSGSPQGLRGTLTKGYISQIRKEEHRNYIQYTSPTSSGNSGGALFLESTQEVIGVPVLIIDHIVATQNLNFAIAINDVKKFLRDNNIKFSSK